MDESPPLRKMIKKRESAYDDLSEAVAAAKKICKEKDFFTYPWKLKREHRKRLGKKYISVEELFAALTPKWKAEGRLSANGLRVRPGKEEAELLGIPENEPIYIYDLSTKCMELFSEN